MEIEKNSKKKTYFGVGIGVVFVVVVGNGVGNGVGEGVGDGVGDGVGLHKRFKNKNAKVYKN